MPMPPTDGATPHPPSAPSAPSSSQEFDRLLEYLRRNRGTDFRGYKRVGLMRRVAKRMHAVRAESIGTYIEYLEQHDDELARLCDTILINVTAFFRDDVPWDYLRTDVIPHILEHKPAPEPIRVWCAG